MDSKRPSRYAVQNRRRSEANAKERLRAIKVLGGKCVKCGFSDPRALQFDHLNGYGSLEYYLAGSRSVIKRALRGDKDVQLLCANCNWIKRWENDEHRKVVDLEKLLKHVEENL